VKNLLLPAVTSTYRVDADDEMEKSQTAPAMKKAVPNFKWEKKEEEKNQNWTTVQKHTHALSVCL